MKAKGWIVVQARRRTYGSKKANGQMPLDSIRITRLTANKPTIEADQEAVEIEIDFPDDYFDTNSPKGSVVVPKQQTATPVVTTAAVKPKAPSAAAAVIHAQP